MCCYLLKCDAKQNHMKCNNLIKKRFGKLDKNNDMPNILKNYLAYSMNSDICKNKILKWCSVMHNKINM